MAGSLAAELNLSSIGQRVAILKGNSTLLTWRVGRSFRLVGAALGELFYLQDFIVDSRLRFRFLHGRCDSMPPYVQFLDSINETDLFTGLGELEDRSRNHCWLCVAYRNNFFLIKEQNVIHRRDLLVVDVKRGFESRARLDWQFRDQLAVRQVGLPFFAAVGIHKQSKNRFGGRIDSDPRIIHTFCPT